MTCGVGSLVKQGIKSISSRTDYNTLCNIDKKVIGSEEQAIRQLEAKPVKGGQYTVLLDPYGVFIHEAFCHLSETDSICENPQMEELLKLGKPIGTEKLNVVDDATIDGLSGSLTKSASQQVCKCTHPQPRPWRTHPRAPTVEGK
ncbi:MAG: metallopeptidase TldD-related protein [Cyanobacteriota bacterium]|nr:metallopeptidase TldD-related protein [Cyanobacteriota bacterium]